MEPVAFASLAHIPVLLVPVGNIRRAVFEKWAADIKTFQSIPLGDVPSDSRDERARFMPSPLASGHLHLSYPSHPPPSTRSSMALFRPADFPLAVVGVASCSQSDALSSISDNFNASLSELFPNGSPFPLASKCFVFEESDTHTNLDVEQRYPRLVIIPGLMGNKTVHIGTLLANLCSSILGEFSVVMQSLESPLGNEYLNATPFPVLPPPSELPKSLSNDGRAHDSLPPLPSHNSQPELTTGTLRTKTPLGLKRSSTGLSPGLLPHRHASLPAPSGKKRQTAIGAASSHGRLFKVLGDLFLLAGRLEDSSVWYTEAIALFNRGQDPLWHASALEGQATISLLEAWASTSATNGAVSDKDPWADIADKLTQATAMYYKTSPSSDSETAYPLQAYLYTQSVLRHSSLLLSIWSGKGWGPLAFTTLLQPGPTPYMPLPNSTPRDAYAELERLTTITGISRTQIAAVVAQAHGPWLLHLGARERIGVLQALAGMYAVLGYPRKEAYILREVLGSVLDLIVCGREESGGRAGGVGLGIRGAAPFGGAANMGTVGVRENESAEGNESVLRIVKHVCGVHGIDLEAVRLLGPEAVAERRARIDKRGDGAVDGDIAEQLDDLAEPMQEPFGWPELQIGIVREAIAVAEALPDYPSVAQFSLSSLKTLHPVMSHSDQHHLYSTAARALATAKRRGDRRTVDYWSGRPIVSIEVLPLPLVRLPLEKPISLLAQGSTSAGPVLGGLRDIFLYNPRKLMSGQAQTVLVQNEAFEVVVTLRNPYVFDLELQSVALCTSGVPVDSHATHLVVPANTFHPVTITGKALEAGILIVRGCVVQAPGGVSREFILPLSTEEEEDRRLRTRSALECEEGRSKRAGLESRPWMNGSKRTSQIAGSSSSKHPLKFLECKVVPEQPLLRIRRTSLTHGAVMLYNGETSTVRITLENVSSLPIDFVRLTFDDSTIAPAQQALADGELSVFETYETEYDLIHRPVFTWDSSREIQEIGPGEKTTLTVSCFGKVGCASGAVNFAYAYVHRRHATLEKPPDVFHTRQLTYPVLVTVYHMLECHAMDILTYSSSTLSTLLGPPDKDEEPAVRARRALLNVDDVEDWCLFSIEVRNMYGLPFEVTFERNQLGVQPASTTTLVPPGSTSRLIMPVKKILLSEEHVSRPIPSLSDRQFVVNKAKLTSTEDKAQRELFWYREELFKAVYGRWRENGGTRSGELSLRQQRMTLPMLEVLRTETARVHMALFHYEDKNPRQVNESSGKFTPPPFEFVYLRTRVTNLSPSELIFTLNLSLHPSRHMIHQGILTDIPIGRLESGASHEVETPVSFVSCGRFDFRADVHAHGLPGDSSHVGRGQLRALVETTT
ncbi:TRAPP II complex [Amylocystis lapponica]|nr:TRAPP II complex [Amylocystis lapponica]